MNAKEKDVRNIELTVDQTKSKNIQNVKYIMQVEDQDTIGFEEKSGIKEKETNINIENYSINDNQREIKNKENEENCNISSENQEKSSNVADEKSTPKAPENTVDKIINELGLNSYNMRIFIVLSLFFLADGAEMIVISLLITKMGQLWNLTNTEKGMMGSAVFVGFFIGALSSGKFSDTKGRKPTFIAGALIVCIFSTLSAFSFNYYWFLIFRALNGFGIGMSIPSSTSLCTEITPTVWRAWVLNMVWIFFPFGEIFAVFIAKAVLEKEDGWRLLLGFAAIPTVLAFIISFFIYESPKYYLATKEYDKAYNGLNRIFKFKNLPELTQETKDKIFKENEESTKNNIKPNFKSLLKKEYLGITLKCCLIFYVSSFIYYGVVYILPQTMESVAKNVKVDASNFTIPGNLSDFDNSTISDYDPGSEVYTNSTTSDVEPEYNLTESERNEMYTGIILSALSEIPSTLITGYLANIPALGRVKSMAYGFILTAFSCLICGIFLDYLSITASLVKFSIDIPFGIIYIYVSEAFPTKIRSIAIGVTNSFNRLGGISTPIFSQLAFSVSNGMPYFLFSFAAIIGALTTFILPFETLGREIH
jgi:MFS family permease